MVGDYEFGQKVRVTATLRRRGTRYDRVYRGGESLLEPSDPYLRGWWAQETINWWQSERDLGDLEAVRSLGPPDGPGTAVELVRYPTDSVGVVVGETCRYAGWITVPYRGEQPLWTADSGVAVYTVALRGQGPAEIVDVTPEDLEPADA